MKSMKKFYEHDGVFISDYQKELFDQMDNYHVAPPEEKKRLRRIYKEITSEAVYSRSTLGSYNGPGTCYYYATSEKCFEMRKKESLWWSDVLSATVGND